MGEVANYCKVWEDEFNKLLGYHVPVESAPPTDHDLHMVHHKNATKIRECMAYYAPKVPYYASLPRLLSFGNQLMQRHEYDLAMEDCFDYVLKADLLNLTDTPRIDAVGRLSYWAQAQYGHSVCIAQLAMRRDADVQHPETRRRLTQSVQEIRDAVARTLHHESLYWLTLNVRPLLQCPVLLHFGTALACAVLPTLIVAAPIASPYHLHCS